MQKSGKDQEEAKEIRFRGRCQDIFKKSNQHKKGRRLPYNGQELVTGPKCRKKTRLTLLPAHPSLGTHVHPGEKKKLKSKTEVTGPPYIQAILLGVSIRLYSKLPSNLKTPKLHFIVSLCGEFLSNFGSVQSLSHLPWLLSW